MRPAITGALPRLAAYGQAMQELKYLCGSGDDYKHRDAVADRVEALEVDNVRLRALIKKAEWVDSCCYDEFCAWCGRPTTYGQRQTGHAADCRAFHPNGDVR